MLICEDCGETITAEEDENYCGQCEQCARLAWERSRRWHAGGADAEFDAPFTAPKPTVH